MAKMQCLSGRLANTFSIGWPSWHHVRADNDFTIHLADHLKEEAIGVELSENPATIINHVRNESQRRDEIAFLEIWEKLEEAMIALVYGSNVIESAGTDLNITIKICQAIFRGQSVDANIQDHDPEYQHHLDILAKTYRLADKHGVIRSRKEVINHAKALNFLIDRIVLDDMSWSEELILETHRILCDGISEDIEASKYRDHEVAVAYSKPGDKKKNSICMRAKAVPRYMKEMIENLNNDIAKAEASGTIDPYTLAARYHYQFVMIHPFGDGNGRTSRVILNVLLLKYAGHVTAFGGEGDDKDDYLSIVNRAHKVFNQEDMEVEFEEQTSHLEFAKYMLRKSKANLEWMWTWARF
ncbi:Fic-domain-containing protein [Thozetella sp. PMI_491]|nr:Fic-domain-containing protein [Thozetella sp. PMI_491]